MFQLDTSPVGNKGVSNKEGTLKDHSELLDDEAAAFRGQPEKPTVCVLKASPLERCPRQRAPHISHWPKLAKLAHLGQKDWGPAKD